MVSWNRWESWVTTPIVARREFERRVSDVDPLDPHLAGRDVEDPGDQHRNGRLAGPGWPDQCDHLPRLDGEGDAAQHRFGDGAVQGRHVFQRRERDLSGGGVPEMHVPEFDTPRAPRNGNGVRLFRDRGGQVEDFEDPLEGHQRAHHVDPDVGQRGQRAVQAGEQQRERDHRAGADGAGHGQPPTQPVGERLGQRGNQEHRDEERPRVHRGQDADVPHPLGPLGEARAPRPPAARTA